MYVYCINIILEVIDNGAPETSPLRILKAWTIGGAVKSEGQWDQGDADWPGAASLGDRM